MGEPRSKMVRRTISGFILKEDQESYYRHRKLFFEFGEPQECELRMVQKDGATFWAHLTATAAEDPDVMPTCRVVLIRTSETDKLCNYFNDPWLNFTGRTLEQEMGNGWVEGVHPDDFDRSLDTYVLDILDIASTSPSASRQRQSGRSSRNSSPRSRKWNPSGPLPEELPMISKICLNGQTKISFNLSM